VHSELTLLETQEKGHLSGIRRHCYSQGMEFRDSKEPDELRHAQCRSIAVEGIQQVKTANAITIGYRIIDGRHATGIVCNGTICSSFKKSTTARLCGHPRLIRWVLRSDQLLNQRLGLRMVCIVFNDEQCGFHYTISASTLSYSWWEPKKRIIMTPFSYCTTAIRR
jgi:hypothetical protein